MFGRKKRNIRKGDHKRILKLLKKCLKDEAKTEKLAELLGYSSNEVKSDYRELIDYIKLQEYFAGALDRAETLEELEWTKRRRSYYGTGGHDHDYFD